MVNKKEYEQGIRCKGICYFCPKNTSCYQGIECMRNLDKKPKITRFDTKVGLR